MGIVSFLEDEGLIGIHFLNPFRWLKTLHKYRITHFLFVGGSGVLIQLLITWALTQFVFGLKRYYIGYSLGLAANLIYNFILHSLVTFKAKGNHKKRFIFFIIYSLLMALAQYLLVRGIVYLIGEKWYILIISTIILIGSAVTFIIFKLWLFKNE